MQPAKTTSATRILRAPTVGDHFSPAGETDGSSLAQTAAPHESRKLTKALWHNSDLTGVMFGQYELGQLLGAGGMGRVYAATHRELGRRVAIKFLPPESAENPDANLRFEQELKALGQLQHEHLLQALDGGFADGIAYCVTQLLEGADLQGWVERRGPAPWGAACELGRQAALGLAEAHRLGIIHRDIKPGNLFLEHDAHLRILDFGLARISYASTAQTSGVTQVGQVMGTLDYIAPEQAADSRRAGAASDLYALGASLIFLLSGQPPYPDATHPDLVNKLHAAIAEAPAWFAAVPADFPQPLLRLLKLLVAKDPQGRPESASAVATALEEWADPAGLQAWIAGAAALSVSPQFHDSRAPSPTANYRRIGVYMAASWLVASAVGWLATMNLGDRNLAPPIAGSADLAAKITAGEPARNSEKTPALNSDEPLGEVGPTETPERSPEPRAVAQDVPAATITATPGLAVPKEEGPSTSARDTIVNINAGPARNAAVANARGGRAIGPSAQAPRSKSTYAAPVEKK